MMADTIPESPGEEMRTEALHCGGDDPHAKIVLRGLEHSQAN